MRLIAALWLVLARVFAADVESPRELSAASIPAANAGGATLSATLPLTDPALSPLLAPVEVAKIAAAAQTAVAAPATRAETFKRASASVRTASALPQAAWAAAFDRANGPSLAEDAVVYRAWQLAQQSNAAKSGRTRFGAFVVDKNGRIVGEGWNRQSTKAERKFLKIGIIMHAEQAAVFQAAKRLKGDFTDARLYVVGISKDGTRYASKLVPGIACDICARILHRNKVDVMASSKDGYVQIAWEKLVELAKGNQGRKWWQNKGKDKPQDPNIRWKPIADVIRRLQAPGEQRHVADLLAQPFVDFAKYVRPRVGQYRPIASEDFLDKIGWQPRTREQLDVLAAKFRFPDRSSGKLRLHLGLFESADKSEEKDPHLMFVGFFYKDKKPVGYFSLQFKLEDGRLVSHSRGIFFDKSDPEISGIGKAIFDFYDKSVYPTLNVDREEGKSNSAGRYVWAKLGLMSFDPDYRFTEGGKATYTYQKMARRNLARFLARHRMKESELVLESGGTRREVRVADLETPADFANVKHRDGRKIRIRPLVNDYLLDKPTDLDVGKAFMLANYHPRGERHIEGIEGEKRVKFSAFAMPYYYRYRIPPRKDPVYEPKTTAADLARQLRSFRAPEGKKISNGVAFRKAGVATPEVLTLRIKRFFFEKILSGEKKFEFREMGRQNDALIEAAVKRGAKFLRLHFQDNDRQLLAVIERIDVVPGAQAAEPWDKEQGTEPGDAPHWRIALRSPTLIWGAK